MSTNSAAPNPKQMLFPPGNIHRKSSKLKVKLGPSYSVSAIWEYIICSVLNLYCMQKCQHPCGWRPGQDNHFKFKNKPPQTPLLCNLFLTKDNDNNKTTTSIKMISARSRNVGALRHVPSSVTTYLFSTFLDHVNLKLLVVWWRFMADLWYERIASILLPQLSTLVAAPMPPQSAILILWYTSS